MDQNRFALMTRSLTTLPSRRQVLRGLSAVGLGVGFARMPAITEAKKKRKHKKKRKKATPNAYGCLNVGQPCNGDSTLCCSGICEGTAPKKGKPDQSRCVAHDAAICRVDFDFCSMGELHVCSGHSEYCQCTLTTGNAPFCADLRVPAGGLCQACSQDTDCQETLGPGAACVVLVGACDQVCPDTGGTACVPTCVDVNE